MSPVLLILVQIAAILCCGRILAVAFRRIGQPSVVAEIVAGIALGPSLLGWVWPDALAFLFPASGMGVLSLVSQLGLVFFMFLVGLEFDARLLRGRGRVYVAISWASILVPFVLGFGLAVPLFAELAPDGVSFVVFALFIGTAMSITAFPVLARILSERGAVRSQIGVIALTCAAVNDATAWCILAFVVAFARAEGPASAVLTTALALAYVAAMIFVVRPLLARVGPRSGTALSADLVAAVFLVLLCSAAATEIIGIHALFGGFLCGAVLPRTGGMTHAMTERIEDFVTIVLLPLFFAYSGLRTEIGLLSEPSSWLTLAVIIVVACVGKFGGSSIAARLSGLGWRESAAIGVLMNTRGLMELVVLNIGLDLGVISVELFTMLMLMALVTTFVTSPLLEAIYPASRMARDLVEDEAQAARDPQPMALLCVSDPALVSSLVAVADALTRHQRGAVWALHLLPLDRPSVYLGGDAPASDAPLERVREEAERRGFEIRPLSFPSAEPSSDIGRVAELKGVPIVLLGVHRSLAAADPFGGTVRAVIEGASSAVAILKDRGLGAVKQVALVEGGGADGERAKALAEQLAAGGATLTVVARGPDVPADTDLVVMALSLPIPADGPSVLAVRAERR